MKKFSVTILAILYLSTSTGSTVYLHYCMGKLVDWSVWHSSNSKCGNCGMEKSHDSMGDGCCKDEYKFIKNHTDQKVVESAFQFQKIMVVAIVQGYTELSMVHFSSIADGNASIHAPPRGSSVPLYVLQRVFLI